MIDSGEPLQLQNQRDRCEQLVSGHYDRLYRWFLWSTNSADNAADRMSLVVDVGGGRGRLLATILERYPRLHGVLFDRPHVIEDARQIIDAAGVGDRCELVGGSFFDAVPTGGDAYILRNIIHDWEDDQAVAILTNCRRAMATGARVVLVELYLAEDPQAALPVLYSDLEMLVTVGGRERTTDEHATLLARGGLRLTQTIALGRVEEAMGYHLIEAQLA
jgi:O-methyltransferase